ncbi:hypothetical protein Q8A64_10485 [Oxalobacteraceae bacterium R-40]|uniref:Uncharacterized protein n=1 Tax=Keguizhuia sedimenti TaxID=3064264 RepID=A0ABU1BQY3_9BURK|nr:hypothetical protein [Oxalobacteraceae bacterium R-40]
MEWIQKWLDERRVRALKKRVERMRMEAQEAELEPLMPAMETISRRIRLERLVVLERVVHDIERRQTVSAADAARHADNSVATQA